MFWYIGYFLTHREPTERQPPVCLAREALCLLKAEDSDAAYVKCFEVAEGAAEGATGEGMGTWTPAGIMDLLKLMDDPAAGGELAWKEEELRPAELRSRVRDKADLAVFRSDHSAQIQDSGEWYICSIVLAEVHDTGSHGESALVWTNSYLVKGGDAESAYQSATDIGRRVESASGSHKCNGDSAHWEFKGLGDLVHTLAAPGDRAILWSREFAASLDEVAALVPPRSELGVFEWENRRSKQPPSA